jgi:hypothetical protein
MRPRHKPDQEALLQIIISGSIKGNADDQPYRNKDYGNWNKNEPVFKLPVFIYQTRKPYSVPPVSPHVLVLMIRPPEKLDLRY